MILSMHISKTAGTTFGSLLQSSMGEKLMLDYGDWISWHGDHDIISQQTERTMEIRRCRDEIEMKYDTIHGHYIADKYLGLFSKSDFVTFVRNPYQQAISNYEYIRRSPQIDHPFIRAFHENNITLIDFIAWDTQRNPQARFLGSLSASDLSMIGITEQFTHSVMLFEKMFRVRLGRNVFENVNPRRNGRAYAVSKELRKAVDKYYDEDVALYRNSIEIFSSLVRRHDV